MQHFGFKRTCFCAAAGLLFIGATACSVSTSSMTKSDIAARAEADKAKLFNAQEPVRAPLTLYQALARAIKYNANERATLMEKSLSEGLADAATYDMLPTLAANGGFAARTKKQGIYGESVADGTRALDDAYVLDKNTATADLQVVYNVLDFGVSYVKAQQASDRKFIAEEAVRKSIQRVVRDTRSAFWRAAAAQRISPDLETLVTAVEEELIRIKVEDERKLTVAQLEERKQLLTVLKTLTEMRQEILTAKADLALLMNVAPNDDFVLDIPSDMDSLHAYTDLRGLELEHFALVSRPELRMSDYEARILQGEAKKEFLRYFPGLEFSAGVSYDSNSYLYNQSWATAGVRVTWNLMSLFSRPQAIRLAEERGNIEETRRVAMTMAIMSQVHVASMELVQNAKKFEIIASLDDLDNRVWQKTFKINAKTKKVDSLEAAAKRLNAHLQRDFAYATYKASENDLFFALGADPLPRFPMTATVDTLAQILEENLSRNPKLPAALKDVSYDAQLVQNAAQTSPFSTEQRDAFRQWAMNPERNPVVTETPFVPKKAPVPKVVKKALPKKTDNTVRRLQVSSFETLADARRGWAKMTAAYPQLATYAPVYKEVDVPAFGRRVRTYIVGTGEKLNVLCRELAAELKSCLITDKE